MTDHAEGCPGCEVCELATELIQEREKLEAAEARVAALEAALADLTAYAERMPGYSLHPLTERVRALAKEDTDESLQR